MSFQVLRNLLGVEYETYRSHNANSGTQYNVFAVTGTIGFGDDGNSVTLGTIPANSDIVGITADVQTAFDSGTDDVIDVGNSSDNDHYGADVFDPSSLGQTVTGWKNLGDVGSSDVTAQIDYVSSGTAPTAGSAQVTIFYVPPAGN